MILHSLLVALLTPSIVFAVKSHDFKTCSQSGFCRRGRALSQRATDAGSSWVSPYSIPHSTVHSNGGKLSANVSSSLYPSIHFSLEVRVHEDGVVRVRMDEVGGLRKRYDEAASWALIKEPSLSSQVTWEVSKSQAKVEYGDTKTKVVVQFNPLKITMYQSGVEQIVLNGRGLLHMEHFRTESPPPPPPTTEGEENTQQEPLTLTPNPTEWFEGTPDALFSETFLSWTDSKPKGPESLSLDISFPTHSNIYGIPQHASPLSLPSTTGEPSPHYTDPYRLYNTDVFEYIADSPMSLYGSIPVMYAHGEKSTVGVFNAIASETWIDVSKPASKGTQTHWISESGILDLFLLPGPTPSEIFQQYAKLTGTPVLPAHWALGYHQCRWNYVSQDDIATVQKRFDEDDMPVDVFWLDIEYSEEHKYFMWEKKHFGEPKEMIEGVEAMGRKMVVIIDPHLKRTSSYPVYNEASALELLVKPSSGQGEFEGWCWSGSSSWVDFFNPNSWKWWGGLFRTGGKGLGEGKDGKGKGGWNWEDSTEGVFIWNDMNEPSVFNGPEITMPKDNVHYGGWEHRDVHNINGMLFTNTTSQGIKHRSDPPQRPFVLTRSFYAGSQRFGAMWTGDNLGTWEHMAVGIKMVLANSIAGMSFAGSDVGGFFGNPDNEMLVRWYQLGAFNPFFRAHAHIDTKRREPFLLEDPYKSIVRDVLKLRYRLLPVWYTAFRETSVSGMPVLRPQWVMFPKDKEGYDVDDQFYVGSSGLLVKPVTEKGAKEATVYLAESQVYYDYFNSQVYRGTAKGKRITVPAELHQTPVLIRGGSIIPTRQRPRMSSPLMKLDPFTLRVALDKSGSAKGELYLDDGVSYNHEKGDIIWRGFEALSEGKKRTVKLTSRDLVHAHPKEAVDGVELTKYDPEKNAFAKTVQDVRVERVVVLGLSGKPNGVQVSVGGGKKWTDLKWEWTDGVDAMGKKEGVASELVIKDPRVAVMKDWSIVIQM